MKNNSPEKTRCSLGLEEDGLCPSVSQPKGDDCESFQVRWLVCWFAWLIFVLFCLLFCFVSKYSPHDKNSQLTPGFMSSVSHFLLGVVMATTLKGKYQPDSWAER